MRLILDWHNHHEILFELRLWPREARIAYIKAKKPPHEQPTRLRLFTEVRNPTPEMLRYAALWSKGNAMVDTGDALRAGDKSLRAKGNAMMDEGNALMDGGRALLATLQNSKTVLALHDKECPNCPWNGTTIFP